MSGWVYQPLLPAAAQLQLSGQIKVWTGAAWIPKPVKVWTGSIWVIKPLKYYNGTQWVITPY